MGELPLEIVAEQGGKILRKDQVALITGSGRGIGRAMAQLFAKEGAAVLLTARTEKELAPTAVEISQAGGNSAFFAGNLASEADCRTAFDRAVSAFGRLEILV